MDADKTGRLVPRVDLDIKAKGAQGRHAHSDPLGPSDEDEPAMKSFSLAAAAGDEDNDPLGPGTSPETATQDPPKKLQVTPGDFSNLTSKQKKTLLIVGGGALALGLVWAAGTGGRKSPADIFEGWQSL